MQKLIDRLPAALASKLRTRFGAHFLRFVVVAVVSLGVSELALAILIGPLHVTAGTSGVSAAIAGAIVSYFLSRWAWKRKGRPNVLRETIPFWLVSVGAWLVLGLATKLGVAIARDMDLHHFERHLVVGGVYFIANCITFVLRFLIFHYVLFADKNQPVGPIENESLSPVSVPVSSTDESGEQH
ncbi:MAG TPA: GtrA family protein [Streptosporangiaceae bacterium]|nr:GtrA family protein [Streptosporangiaceae bacterium]